MTEKEADQGRILKFRHRTSADLGGSDTTPPDLTKFEQGNESDDYRHRMTTNVIAFVFVIALIGAGLWLADTMASMRKNQDCVLSGRRGCTPVDIDRPPRF